MPDTHTYTHSCPPLILRVHEHTHIGCAHLQPFQECFDNTHTRTHTSSCLLEIWLMMTHTYTHPYSYPRFIACTDTYFSFRRVSLARMRRYMQLVYLFHQYAKSLSTDGRKADCTVRHPGVERPFSSLYDDWPSSNLARVYDISDITI